MVILAKKFLTKFTKIWNFIPNTVFGDRPVSREFEILYRIWYSKIDSKYNKENLQYFHYKVNNFKVILFSTHYLFFLIFL